MSAEINVFSVSEDDPRTPGKGSGKRNVDGGLQVQLEEDGGSNTSGLWTVTPWNEMA